MTKNKVPCACGCGELVDDDGGYQFKNLKFGEDDSVSFEAAIIGGIMYDRPYYFKTFAEFDSWVSWKELRPREDIAQA